MISQLVGKVVEIFDADSKHITIFTDAGVGYEVYCATIMQDGDRVGLFIHTDVRENAIDLYGFQNQSEREFFRKLIEIKGLGPKTSLIIMSEYPISKILEAIESKNEQFFTKIKGIGKKVSQNIVTNFK